MAKKTLLIVDHWHHVSGGASKSVLYSELEKQFNLIFLKTELPTRIKLWSYIKTFHPDIRIWEQRKSTFDEISQKYPRRFRLLSRLYNDAIQKIPRKYHAILQIGSLFSPEAYPEEVPCFSYSDSTVKNPDLQWPDWMPPDFDRYRNEWYALEKDFFRNTTAVMTYSEFAKRTLTDEYNIDGGKIHVVGSALKIPGDFPVDWDKRARDVIFVGTEFKRKGGHLLSEIFRKVHERHPDSRLYVVGAVPEDFQPAVEWIIPIGTIDEEELIALYQTSSVLLHPAQYDPFPSVVLEAANFEIPAVAGSVCGIPEMIEEGKTGFVIQGNDTDAYAEHICWLLENDEQCQKMGKAAKIFVNERFHPKVVASRIAKVVKREIGDGSRFARSVS